MSPTIDDFPAYRQCLIARYEGKGQTRRWTHGGDLASSPSRPVFLRRAAYTPRDRVLRLAHQHERTNRVDKSLIQQQSCPPPPVVPAPQASPPALACPSSAFRASGDYRHPGDARIRPPQTSRDVNDRIETPAIGALRCTHRTLRSHCDPPAKRPRWRRWRDGGGTARGPNANAARGTIAPTGPPGPSQRGCARRRRTRPEARRPVESRGSQGRRRDRSFACRPRG